VNHAVIPRYAHAPLQVLGVKFGRQPGRANSLLLDADRTIGQPDKITVIFGRKITKHYRDELQTEIEDMNLPNPVIRSTTQNGFIKQYVPDHVILRTEPDRRW
jgi:hypothetical protein